MVIALVSACGDDDDGVTSGADSAAEQAGSGPERDAARDDERSKKDAAVQVDAARPVMDAGSAGVGGDADAAVQDTGVADAAADAATDAGTAHVTECRALDALASGAVCEVATAGGSAKLITGDILTPATVLRGGQLLIDERGVIACAACDCSGQAAAATEITCPRGVVSPGLINAHDHLGYSHDPPAALTAERYEHRHDWRAGLRGHTAITTEGGASIVQLQWAELRMLMSGTTSIASEGGVPGLVRNLDSDGQEGLGRAAVQTETFPLDDAANPIQRDGDCEYGPLPVRPATISSRAFLAHVAEGIDAVARNEFLCLSSTTFDTAQPGLSDDLLLPQSAFVHAIALSAPDYAAMAQAGTALVWSPRSNLALYGDTAQVRTAAEVGVLIALGTDWLPTGSMNSLRELACADSWNQRYLAGYFRDEELWRMVTSNAATVTGSDDLIGALVPGRIADVAVFDGSEHPLHRAVIAALPGDVSLVLRSGLPLYGDEALIAALPDGEGCEAVSADPAFADVCGVAKRVCTLAALGQTFADLAGANAASYPAFSCGVPEDEPSCTPQRTAASGLPSGSVDGSGLYDGTIDADDLDGDGVPNGSDDCPSVFNPVRPVDDGAQADSDADGEGDACDPCPTDAHSTKCPVIDPQDADGDGVPNALDLCSTVADADQVDADHDGKGDACDPCPDRANPGADTCDYTIYAIKTGTVAVGTPVHLVAALVTGKGPNGLFVQAVEGDPGYQGENHSGLFIFTDVSTLDDAVAIGQRVDVTGTVASFQGQIQLAAISALTVVSTASENPPAPQIVNVAEVTTDGPRAAPLEGVIVEIQDATVTAGLDAANEFTVRDISGSTLKVDDFLFLVSPGPAVNATYQRLRGILALRSVGAGQSVPKLLPRSAADLD